ncbi:MAG: CDP-alcohol phosphatidyltransferase family protein [Dehalococcoidia bacterium]
MANDQFAGDKKKGDWILAKAEKRMVNWMTPRVPPFLETYHLTMLTLIWSIGIVACSVLAMNNINWLWAVSGFIFLQYISDVLDGAVGRYRETGLVKWGFYMDHLLDYAFLASVIAGYALVFAGIPWHWFLALMALGGAFMANTFLSFAATNELRISVLKIGPTEGRIFFVLLNTAIILLGAGWVETALPFMVAGLTVALIFLVVQTQKRIWKIDMDQKNATVNAAEGSRPAGSVPERFNPA